MIATPSEPIAPNGTQVPDTTAKPMTFAEKFHRLCLQLRWSYKAVADGCGISYGSLLSLVRGAQRTTSVPNAIELARFFGVTVEWLFDDGQGWPPPFFDPSAAPTIHDVPSDPGAATRNPLTEQDTLARAPSALPLSIGEKIARRLVEKSWSQSRLACEVGVTLPAISRIVSGGDPSSSLAFRIAVALGLEPAWLFDGSQGWPPPPAVESPPIAIYPWPPHGITWAEVQAAISNYVNHRVALQLAALDDPNQQTNHPENIGDFHVTEDKANESQPDPEAANHPAEASAATSEGQA